MSQETEFDRQCFKFLQKLNDTKDQNNIKSKYDIGDELSFDDPSFKDRSLIVKIVNILSKKNLVEDAPPMKQDSFFPINITNKGMQIIKSEKEFYTLLHDSLISK